MDRTRLLLAMILSAVVLIGWPAAMRYLYPPPPIEQTAETDQPKHPPTGQSEKIGQGEKIGRGEKGVSRPPATSSQASPVQQTTQVAEREIVIETPYYRATLTNRGAVATSWILKREKDNDGERELRAANGDDLELIPPKEITDRIGAPLRLRLPWAPAVADQLNQSNFQIKIDGLNSSEQIIELNRGEQREITFTYEWPRGTARKKFTFYGDRFVFDATANVVADGGEQPVELVMGPRIGDQTDRQTGSYSTPPQVIALNRAGEREQILGASITGPFAKITSVSDNRIEIDKPISDGVDQIKIVGPDGHTFLGYTRVVGRDSNRSLALDALPQGAGVGSGVAHGTDTFRHGYYWAGLVDHYFAMVAVGSQPIEEITLANVQIKESGQEQPPLDYPSVAVPVRPDAVTHFFVGPKDREMLAAVGAELGTDLGALLDYGMFAAMIRPLVPAIGWALDGLAKLFNNYGWAIVVVTAVINLALSPLRWFSSKKMKQAAKHQPRLKELQDRMKDLKKNPKKYERELQHLQQEQIALMKEANPLGGCLPMLLQMPIFWAFFVYLTISLDVRHAPWLFWVRDLSKPDPYYVLPIVMCVTMIASTKLTPQPATDDPSMKMQRMMMTWLMPIMLTWFFFFSAPSGLVLYWMVSNVVGVLIQVVINRLTAEPTQAGAPQAALASTNRAGAAKSGVKSGKKAEAGQKRKASEKEVVEGVK